MVAERGFDWGSRLAGAPAAGRGVGYMLGGGSLRPVRTARVPLLRGVSGVVSISERLCSDMANLRLSGKLNIELSERRVDPHTRLGIGARVRTFSDIGAALGTLRK